MLRTGIEAMFTGDAGTATYLLLVVLISLVYIGRAAPLLGRGSRKLLPAVGLGIPLFVASRFMLAYPIGANGSPISILPLAMGSAAWYLLFVTGVTPATPGRPAWWNRRVLVTGVVSGLLLGGAVCTLLAKRLAVGVAVPILQAFLSLVPLGLLAGLLLERRGNHRAGADLSAASGALLAAATMIAGLIALGVFGTDFFFKQLFHLTDAAGLFLLIASAVSGWRSEDVRSGGEDDSGGDEGARACEGSGAGTLRRIREINRRVVSGCSSRDVLGEIARSIADEVGADLVLLRSDTGGNGIYEVKACCCSDQGVTRNLSNLAVTEDTYLGICSGGNKHPGGYVVGFDETEKIDGMIVPEGIDWKGKKVCVIPIREKASLRGFFTIGFFVGEPPARIAAVQENYVAWALHVIQCDRHAERLREKERALSVCREELDGVNQLKSNFLSVVSHELRTPLTSVKAYNETLLDNLENIKRETIRDFLRVMGEESERLIKLVDNMLNYSYMETGHLKVEKTSCNLNEIVQEVHEKLQERFLADSVNCELRMPRSPVMVDADRELIGQLIQNLMSNAVKFTPAGGRVTVTLDEEASAARIVVHDTGRGIPEDQLEKIFERFYQVDASNTREHGGSGLGLAICKNIVDWHDGKIWVENVKDAGAKFVVLLPMKDVVVRQVAANGFLGSVRFERERYLTLLVEMLSEFLQARKASIMLLDKDQNMLRIVAAKGLDPEFVQNTRLEVGDRIAGKVFEQGKSLYVFDIEEDMESGRANNSMFYGTHSFISVPLKDAGEIVGVVNVSDHVEGREFSRADRELLESLGSVIVGMLHKLDAYEKVSSNFDRLRNAMRYILDVREAWGSRMLSNLTLLALAVGRKLDLDEKSLTALRLGMNLYDLGMMKVPRNIRVKKEELDEKEREKLRAHPNMGYAQLSPMGLEERIMRIVRSHHENYDGSGYPDGLAGMQIPAEARIVNVVDTFRALVSQGPYRRCYSIDEARNEIVKGAGSAFDPRVVDAFVKVLHELDAREEKGELVLGAVERELAEQREERTVKGGERLQVAIKEGTP